MEAITKKYGPVSSVRLGSKLLVIIGTVKPAVALLEGRSGIYCDWPRLGKALCSLSLFLLCDAEKAYRNPYIYFIFFQRWQGM
ncbi:hypothetical protein BY996DRAFT_7092584, partial [Phakopsora pachyrhizi]